MTREGFPRGIPPRARRVPIDERRAVAEAIRDYYPSRFWLTPDRQVLQDLDTATGELRPSSLGTFKASAPHAVHYVVSDDEPERTSAVPARVLQDVYYDPSFYKVLAGVVRCPWVDRSGRQIAREGYDAGSRTWLHWPPNVAQRVQDPSTVTDAEVRDVLDRLLDLGFESHADRAAALAMFMQAVRGPASYGFARPLFIVCAPAMESGKTYLVDLVGHVVSGRPVQLSTLPPSEEELFYSLPALLSAGEPIVAFDNAKTEARLESAVLQAYLTAGGPVSSRQVRTSRAMTIDPTRTLWVLSINRPDVDAETGRRSVLIRLRPKTTPHKTANLKAWILEHRARVVSVLHRLVRDWIDAGRPMPVQPIPSFEAWSEHVLAPALHAMPEAVADWQARAQPVPKEEREWARLFGEVWPRDAAGKPKHLQAKEVLALVDGADLYTLHRLIERGAPRGSERGRESAMGRILSALAEQSAARPVQGWTLRVVPRSRDGRTTRYYPHSPHSRPKSAEEKAKDERQSPHLPHSPHSSDGLMLGGGGCVGGGIMCGECADPESDRESVAFESRTCSALVRRVRNLDTDPDREIIRAIADRGIRVDADAWSEAWHVAEADLAGRDDERSRDRLRALQGYAAQVYAQAEAGDGRVRATPAIQPTGRIGYIGPALQSVTKSYGLRAAVVPAEGCSFVVGDWRSAHLWIAAAVSGDAALLADLQAGDVYQRCGEVWLPDADADAQRRLGKRLALESLNGAGVDLLVREARAAGAEVAPGEGWARREAWLNRYPVLRDVLRQLQAAGEAVTLGGAVVCPPPDRKHATPAWLWQAVEAEALRAVLRESEAAGLPVVLTLHDEVLWEVPSVDAEAVADRVAEVMARALRTAAELPEGCDLVRVEVRGTWARAGAESTLGERQARDPAAA